MHEIKSRRLGSIIFQFYLKKNDGFIYKSNSSEKNVLVEEKLDCIDIDDIRNIEDSPRLVFIDEKCGNILVVNDGVEQTRNINQKKDSDILQQPIDVYSVTNVVGKCIYSVIMRNIYCESVR